MYSKFEPARVNINFDTISTIKNKKKRQWGGYNPQLPPPAHATGYIAGHGVTYTSPFVDQWEYFELKSGFTISTDPLTILQIFFFYSCKEYFVLQQTNVSSNRFIRLHRLW